MCPAVLPHPNNVRKASDTRLRDELLNGEIFYSLQEEAKTIIGSWRRHYNHASHDDEIRRAAQHVEEVLHGDKVRKSLLSG